jgi:predicted ATP-dependent endonuclease of OLD family
MLTRLSVNHYKAFDSASVKIRPITILLGANSVGKSSILQLFLMLQQTGKAGLKSYKSALKLYGGYVNLGDPQNLFRKRDKSKPVTLTFELKNKILKDFLKNDYFESFSNLFSQLPMYFPIKGFSSLQTKQIKNKDDFSKYLDMVTDVLNKPTIKDEFRNEINYFLRRRHDLFIPQINKNNKKEFVDTFEFLYDLSKKIKTDEFLVSYDLILNDSNNLEISKLIIRQNEILILEMNCGEEIVINSDIIKISKQDEQLIKKLFLPGNTIFNSFTTIDNDPNFNISIKSSVIIQIVNLFQNEIRKEFSEEKINYVSPLRAHPKRYYMLDKAKLNLTLDTLDGDAIAEVLKDNKQITKDVNQWLKNFGVEVDVHGFKEVIHQLVVKQNNIDLDITDVGFGISQILPVIIQGFLSTDNSTTIIEQPEIHLHPKMQADLADLFIDIVKKKNGKKLIIETHSEYLLKRLRRRISEGAISPDDVSICLFNPQTKESGATIDNLEIAEKGFFDWPVDFYGGEILKDTTEFLKNQSK